MPDITSTNIKIMARTPIIPDDFSNKLEHKDKELVMDFSKQDLYVKVNGAYINITGQIRDSVQEIQDGSAVIHLVTEDALPPIKDRQENHWYWVIESAEDIEGGTSSEITQYIYYGVVDDSYLTDRNYLLIGQNVTTGASSVTVTVVEGYTACFYVPITMEPTFTNITTGEVISYEIVDRLYALNTQEGSYISYDVYMLDILNPGDIHIGISLEDLSTYTTTFSSNNMNISGLSLPSPVKTEYGNPVGSVSDPTWNEARYGFKGWSSDQTEYNAVSLSSYRPDDDTTLYAWFEYDDDETKLEYYNTYVSNSGVELETANSEISTLSTLSNNTSSGKILGTFCSVENKDVVIKPKNFKGYITPEGQVLTEDKSHFTYTYTPIQYNITYDLDGGEFLSNTSPKTTYTIEDSKYTPPTPYKAGYLFTGWKPSFIPAGSTEDVKMKANWKVRPILLNGSSLNSVLKELIGENIVTSIKIMEQKITDDTNMINVSSTDNPIYVECKDYTIILYSEDRITFNSDMSNAFKDFEDLSDIEDLSKVLCYANTDISNIFSGCSNLSDVTSVESWPGKSCTFNGAFDGTLALLSGTTPTWYRTKATIYYSSIDGKILEKVTKEYIPGQKLYPKSFSGYDTPVEPVVISMDSNEYIIDYHPIEYNITYNLANGTITGNKTKYTVEDIDYYPPTPIKDGYTFIGWSPEYIPSGSIGDKVFIAKFTKI